MPVRVSGPVVVSRRLLRGPATGRSEQGAVTAEAVMVLPLLAAVALGLAWLLTLAGTQVRVVDAAREVARAAARDDSPASAKALGRAVAPRGAKVSLHDSGDQVVAVVAAEVSAPAGLFGFLPPVRVDAQAVAAKEAR
jgi:Flp pilus assembly protein TadG